MLIYLHGFNSAPQSHKASLLRRDLEARGLADHYACPALPHWPKQAIAVVEAEMARHPKDRITLIGSSLGGYYATWLAERHGVCAVLLNPAIHPERDLAKLVGPQRNLYTGEEYELTPEHVRQLEQLRVARIKPSRYLLIVETGDELLDYREAVERYRGARQIVIEGGDHTLTRFIEHIPAILAFARLDTAKD